MDKRYSTLDVIVVLLIPIIAVSISFLFPVNAFFSVILFFGLLSAYLSFRNPKYIKKCMVFSLVTGVPAIIVIDYIAHLTGQWQIPNSILPYRLLEYVSIEVIIWTVLNLYSVVIFYEHFLDHSQTKRIWNSHIRTLIKFLSALVVLFFTAYFLSPNMLKIPYFYLVFGCILIIFPVMGELAFHPKLIRKFVEVGAYFFYLCLLYEIVALKLDWWRFPSDQYIGRVTLFNVSFPFEELFCWLMFFSMAILTVYERFSGVKAGRERLVQYS